MRRLLRMCFRNVAPAQVPLEIWWDIVLGTELPAMTLLAQTCKGFWELVDEIRRRNIKIALEYRRMGQIPLAKKCLKMCADHGIPEAMFHMGYAKQFGGFGFKKSYGCNDWIEKASNAGYPLAMAMTAYLYRFVHVREMLTEKVMLSKDSCAIGYCRWQQESWMEGVSHFKASANSGNEFGQFHLAYCYEVGVDELVPRDLDLAVYWHTKAAEQGHAKSQYFLYQHYRSRNKCSKKKQYWHKKLDGQNFKISK